MSHAGQYSIQDLENAATQQQGQYSATDLHPSASEPPEEGWGSAFAHALGFPTSAEEAQKMLPTDWADLGKKVWEHVNQANPGNIGANIVESMAREGVRGAPFAVKTLNPLTAPLIQEDPMSSVHALASVNPFAAPVIDQMTQLREAGKDREADATGVIGAASLAFPMLKSGIPKLMKALGGPSGEPAITAAVNPPKNVRANFRQAVQQAGPELEGVGSVEELRDLASQKRMEAGQKMDAALQESGMNNMLDMKSIENAIVRTNMGRVQQVAGTDAALESFARKYTALPMSVGEASNEIQLINAQLSSLRNMTPAERLMFLKQHPEMAALDNIKGELTKQIQGFAGNQNFRSANAEYARWRTIQDATQQSLDDFAAKGGNVQRKGAVPGLIKFGANTLPAVGAGVGEAVGGWPGAGIGGGAGMFGRDAIIARFADPDYLVRRGAASFSAPSPQVTGNPLFNFTKTQAGGAGGAIATSQMNQQPSLHYMTLAKQQLGPRATLQQVTDLARQLAAGGK